MNRCIYLMFFSCVLLLGFQNAFGQSTKEAEAQAQLYLVQKEYDKALPLLRDLYLSAPFDKKFYDQYLSALLETKNYDTAIELGDYMRKIRKEDLSLYVDMANAYELKGKKKEAEKLYQEAIGKVGANEFLLTNFRSALRFYKKRQWEIVAIENYRNALKNPYMFANELALLYNEEGQADRAIATIMDALNVQPYGLENTKQALETIIAGDEKKLKKVRNLLAKKMEADPANYAVREMFTWLQSQIGDKNDVLKEVIKMDQLQGKDGVQVMQHVQDLVNREEYESALQALDYILKKGTVSPAFEAAQVLQLNIRKYQLDQTYPQNKEKVGQLLQDYERFFQTFPKYKNQRIALDYAEVIGLYDGRPQAALEQLTAIESLPYTSPEIVGEAKLAAGDYLIFIGKVWEAALQYAQVDKMFKEDRLGEEARFRNAKLSYYRGDFEYAQAQLSVLKASTTELIANDALNLSVLIVENTPQDKNFQVLNRFAFADLLQFQNRLDEAQTLLDSLSKAYPDNDLQDDILMNQAKIASKKQDYASAVRHLTEIQSKYGDDVLADDATMRLATIFEQQFKQKDKALQQYELLITKYPGSTFVQEARAKYEELKQGI